MPLPAAAQVPAPPARLVVFQTCWPPTTPKPPNVTHAVLLLFGSTATRCAARPAGKEPEVTSVSVLEPVVVAQTWPFLRPTIRTLSFWGDIAIVTIGDPPTMGPWLTTAIRSPL